ncbi:tetratricopeptide repeat protein [Antarcticirhabdus aurantiaca]|uniref:Tetratricopeptide repeat protein n=1 Tax=Antarcticirhabdus aurantiaca TaxID=2606717 RepID=A0ACD4NUF0_9HYPH|nr:tetratricopeptide repeat protein [Antarcticirhabdus aurantiaca]WAJ30502.1 tetratricopeptide repeat protein [Jeongeuplla avenae]
MAEAAGDPSGHETAHVGNEALARLFRLPPEDARTVASLAQEMLSGSGVDATRFFAALDAGEGFGAALGLTPPVLEALYARAYRWFTVGHPEKAEPLFRALCVADPGNADAFVGLGICLRLLGRVDAARLALDTAARLRPDWAVPTFHLCELALACRDDAAAARHLEDFRNRARADTPAAMSAEAARFAQVLALRRRRPEAAAG